MEVSFAREIHAKCVKFTQLTISISSNFLIGRGRERNEMHTSAYYTAADDRAGFQA